MTAQNWPGEGAPGSDTATKLWEAVVEFTKIAADMTRKILWKVWISCWGESISKCIIFIRIT